MESYRISLVFLILVGASEAGKMSDLYKTLFNNYTSEILPKCNHSAAIQVQIGMALRQIIDLNEPRQVLETVVWLRLKWNDCQLQWDPETTGIKNMVVPLTSIWTPDITLYDNAQNSLGGAEDYRPNIYPNGDVYYNFPSVINSLCKVDVTYFPFDVQTCTMQFGSWSYHGWDLNLSTRATSGDMSIYVASGEWSIIKLPAIRHELLYNCCPEPYPDVTFYIQIRRKPLFYLMNLILPCTLISTMACLGFLLPPDSGEKVSLEITVLLSLAVFLLVVSETMPPDSETFPFIGVYFACAMLLVSMSCLMTVTVLNLHFKGDFGKKLPGWVRTIFLECLGRVLCVKISNNPTRTDKFTTKNGRPTEVYDNHGFPVYVSKDEGKEFETNANSDNNINRILNDMNHTNHVMNVNEVVSDHDTSNEVVALLMKQLDCLNTINGYIDDKQRLEINMEDWKKLAQVVDRIFMVMFFIFQVSTSLAILVRISTADQNLDFE